MVRATMPDGWTGHSELERDGFVLLLGRDRPCGVRQAVVTDLAGVAGPPGVGSRRGASSAPPGSAVMADKSPRQSMSKKDGKSLKEKRAAKHAKSDAKHSAAPVEIVAKGKKR
jgi:hypothetical protein